MTTRQEQETQAKNAGVDSPEELPTASDVKEATDVARDVQNQYFYPEHGVTVVAKNREEADTKLQETLKGKK